MLQRTSAFLIPKLILVFLSLAIICLASPAAFGALLTPVKIETDDVNTDAGRHQLGTALLRENKPREAAEVLSKISDDYPPAARTEARWWWAVAAQQVLNEKLTDKEKQSYQAQLIRALEGIPEPDLKEVPEIVRIWVQARLQLGQIHYECNAFDRVEALGSALQKRLPQFEKLDPGDKKNWQYPARALVNYAQYGKASAGIKAGTDVAAHRRRVGTTLENVRAQVKAARAEEAGIRNAHDAAVAAVAQAPDNEKEIKEATAEELKEGLEATQRHIARDVQLQRALFSLCLRAALLDGDHDHARELLQQLDSIKGEGDGFSVYLQVVAELRKQLEELKQGGDKTKERYDKIRSTVKVFLDDSSKKPQMPEMIYFLAQTYGMLDKYAEGAALLAKIADPGDKGDEQAKRRFKAAQLLRLEYLRKAKQFDDAFDLLNKLLKTDWGGKSIELFREKALLYEDDDKHGAAAVAWKDVMARLYSAERGPLGNLSPRAKEQYFEAYFHYVRGVYFYGKAQMRQDYIERAAKAIKKLKDTEPNYGGAEFEPLYKELLKQEPDLKKALDDLEK
jgi:hypothetical protein